MHHSGIPRHAQSMIAYRMLTEYFCKFEKKLHCGNVVNIRYTIHVCLLVQSTKQYDVRETVTLRGHTGITIDEFICLNIAMKFQMCLLK